MKREFVRPVGGGSSSVRGSSRGRGGDRFGAESDGGGAELREGDRVEGRFGGKGKWYPGKIDRVNLDGTFNISYDDGDRERGVKREFVRPVGGGSSSVRGRATARSSGRSTSVARSSSFGRRSARTMDDIDGIGGTGGGGRLRPRAFAKDAAYEY